MLKMGNYSARHRAASDFQVSFAPVTDTLLDGMPNREDSRRVNLSATSASSPPRQTTAIPRTLGDDGDPLDVLVMCSEPLEPLTLVRCYPIGVMRMTDGGAGDEKVIAIPWADPTYEMYTDISELPKHIFDEIKHFFSVYKDLEGKKIAVNEFDNPRGAVQVIEECIERYKGKFGNAQAE